MLTIQSSLNPNFTFNLSLIAENFYMNNNISTSGITYNSNYDYDEVNFKKKEEDQVCNSIFGIYLKTN